MSRIAFVLALVFSLIGTFSVSAFAQSRGCNQKQNPHSFGCQNETFFGRIFPLVPASKNRVVGNWRTLVYTPPPNQPAIFRSAVSNKNPHIPTGLINPDGSLVGLFIWPTKATIQFLNFGASGNTIKQSSAPGSNGASVQVLLTNPGEGAREAFSCRVFLRNQSEHMLCQWNRDQGRGFQFMGYLGFVR